VSSRRLPRTIADGVGWAFKLDAPCAALAGQRTFSVYMEGLAMLTNFDIVARAGGKGIGE
jgi:hypothetical protein